MRAGSGRATSSACRRCTVDSDYNIFFRVYGRDGVVEWKPAVDVNRLAKGGQVLAGIVAVCVTLALLRRRR